MGRIHTLGIVYLLLFQNFAVFSQTNVLTQHNDNMRTGWNATETVLNTSNVKKDSFGLLFLRPLDDQMYAQPLVVTQVNIAGTNRNVVYAASVNNTVYAYDADSSNVTSPYWQINLTESGMRPPNNGDVGQACGIYTDFTSQIGIVGTPVIDLSIKKLFVVARSVDVGGNFYQYLHAIDITNGNDSKVQITAQVPGTGIGSISGNLAFNPITHNQRCALLLVNGIIYIAYSSHCDTNPYHGWILGYDENLTQQYAFVNTPNDEQGGIWMSGAGPAADPQGNIYVAAGNGTGTAGSSNLQMSITQLTPISSPNTLSLSSFFIPNNYDSLGVQDQDFGPIQVLLIPNTTVALTGCKDGNLYLVDRSNMGGLGSSNNNRQTLFNGGSMHSSFGYYKGTTQEFIYLWSEGIQLEAIPFNRSSSLLGTPVRNSVLQGPVGGNGAFLSVSSSGSIDSTGILWVAHAIAPCDAGGNTCPGILRAISASDITKELWNSTMASSDAVGNYAKFSCPTIANGKVYLATFSKQLMVYGLTHPPVLLPITLSSFYANRMSNFNVNLYWETDVEQNNQGFEVQRNDGADTFRTVSFVRTKANNGNSDIPINYQFSDTNSSDKETLYRLAQIDLDGHRTLSKIVIAKGVDYTNEEKTALLVYPNPSFSSMVTVKYNLNESGDVALKIIDFNGNSLQTVFIPAQTAGKHKYLISDLNLQPGNYVMTLELNNVLITAKKFIIRN
jgi:Secretion system C-terminal sorting domain